MVSSLASSAVHCEIEYRAARHAGRPRVGPAWHRRGLMSVRIGRISHEDRHKPRLRTGEPRGHRGSHRHVYGQRLFGYAQLLLPDSVAAAEVVDSVLEAAAERDAVRDQAGARPPGGDEARAGDNLRALMYAAVRRECRKRRLASGWASYASEPQALPP